MKIGISKLDPISVAYFENKKLEIIERERFYFFN